MAEHPRQVDDHFSPKKPMVFSQNIMKSSPWGRENDALMKKNRNPGMTQKRELKGYHINEPVK